MHTGKSHGGNCGTFCANQAECTARLTNRNPKPVEHDTAPKFVCLDRDALLRSNPCLNSSTNGAQAQEGDQVLVYSITALAAMMACRSFKFKPQAAKKDGSGRLTARQSNDWRSPCTVQHESEKYCTCLHSAHALVHSIDRDPISRSAATLPLLM